MVTLGFNRRDAGTTWSLRAKGILLCSLLLLASCAGNGNSNSASSLNAGLAASSWPKFRGDAGNTGWSKGRGAKGELKWTWSHSTSFDYYPSEVTLGEDGSVFVRSESHLYCLDPAAGAEKWRFSFETYFGQNPAIAANGRLFVLDDNFLYALNSSSGHVDWKLHVSGGSEAPSLGQYGGVYFGTWAGYYAVDPSSKEIGWFDPRGYSASPPAFGPGNVLYTTDDLTVSALEGGTGKPKWTQHIDSIHGSPVCDSKGTVYVARRANIIALDRNSGEEKWRFPSPDSYLSMPAVSPGDSVYTVSGDGTVSCIRKESGTLIWSKQLGDRQPYIEFTPPTLDADGRVYVTVVDQLYVLDGVTGNEIWSLPLGRLHLSSPVIGADGTVYVFSTANGTYYPESYPDSVLFAIG